MERVGSYAFRLHSENGPRLRGAIRMTNRSKFADADARSFLEYKSVVRLIADSASVPASIPEDRCVHVRFTVAWKEEQRIDADNLIKGILDALWPEDKRVLNVHYCAEEFTCQADQAFIEIDYFTRRMA